MKIYFTSGAEDDLSYLKKTNNKIIQKRISELFASISENPYKGIGKPEPLKENLSGYWSRRINREHRIVYTVAGGAITVISLRFHYT